MSDDESTIITRSLRLEGPRQRMQRRTKNHMVNLETSAMAEALNDVNTGAAR